MRLFTPLSYLVFWLALPYLLMHKKLRQGVRARLGLYPRGWPDLSPRTTRVWLHGASAGDILALLPTVRALKERDPKLQCVATTMTDSGYQIAEANFHLLDAVAYCPYDLPGATARAVARIGPDALVLEYTELWPQLIYAARQAHVPVLLHNGRIAKGKLHQYRWLFRLTGNLLQSLTRLLMRDESEAERARALGAAADRVEVTGNTKFDNVRAGPNSDEVRRMRAALPVEEGADIWVAGSTHDGEEENLLAVHAALQSRRPSLCLILAPRYVERAEKIRQMAIRQGLRVQLRSRFDPTVTRTDVFILDTIGELRAAYALATVVFVGGSFVTRGGQNILEPAVCGKAVIFGPDMRNFTDSVQVLLGRGGIQVASYEQLERIVEDLLGRPEHCRELGAMAREQVQAISGAAARNATAILQAAVNRKGASPASSRAL